MAVTTVLQHLIMVLVGVVVLLHLEPMEPLLQAVTVGLELRHQFLARQ